jgi:hypothetical protein
VVIVGAALAAAVPPAVAGSYDVYACVAGGGGAQNAFAAVADPGMTAYSSCPNVPSNPASGMVARASATNGPGWVGYMAGAYQIFEAPPGASLASVTFDVAAIKLASYWSTGLVAYDGDFNVGDLPYGCYPGSPGCGIGTPSFFGPVTARLGGHSRFRLETRCLNRAGCDISASGFPIASRALFAAANVVVRVQDYTAPAIHPVYGALWQEGWHRGPEEAWQTLSDNVGIMVQRLYVDGRVVAQQDFRDPAWPGNIRCDFTRRRPCNDIAPAGLPLDTRSLDDGLHVLRLEAIDAAGNPASVGRRIGVDNTPPTHVDAHVVGGDGWRRANDFAVGWRVPADPGAPIARAHYTICSGADPKDCVRATSARSDRIDRIRVPAEGTHLVRVWLEDAAGNANEADAGAPAFLRLDQTPPEAAFVPTDAADPIRVDVTVSDRASGVSDGTIELRRIGRREWQELETHLEDGHLRAYVDDSELADGRYELRAIVRDQAGNEQITGERADGSKMELALPLRLGSRMLLSSRSRHCRRKRGRHRRRCRRRSPAPKQTLRGYRRLVRGKLETATGQPLTRASIDVLERPRGANAFRRAATVTAAGDGRFSYRIARGGSRMVRFRWNGTALIKPALAELKVLVPARTSIASSRRFLRNGQTVIFRGRLAGRPVPDGGKLIDLQAYYRGRWRTFATPRTDAAGRWRFRYRFEATRGLVRYRFRARIRREAAYPYELGYSRVVAVTVRGP